MIKPLKPVSFSEDMHIFIVEDKLDAEKILDQRLFTYMQIVKKRSRADIITQLDRF